MVVIGDAASGGDAVGDDDFGTEFVAEGLGDIGAKDEVEDVLGGPTGGELNLAIPPEPEVLIEVFGGADDAETAVGVAEGVGDGPRDSGVVFPVEVGFVGDVVGGLPDAEDAVQQ